MGRGCIALREQVLAEIEPLRKDKQIGSSLQAKVVLSAPRRPSSRCSSRTHAQLPMLFIVSEVELRPAPPDVEAHAEAKPRVTIERAGGVKCERCWRYVPAVSTRSGLGRAVRALPGRARRDRSMDDAINDRRSAGDVGAAATPRRTSSSGCRWSSSRSIRSRRRWSERRCRCTTA